MKEKGERVSLALKLNALIIIAIVITTAGLILASGNIYTLTIENVYSGEADKILDRVTRNMDPDEIYFLKQTIETEEFRTVREEALAKNDARIVQTWLRRQPSFFVDERQFDTDYPDETLYSDYLELYSYLTYVKRFSTCDRLFLSYASGTEKRLLADTEEQALGIGAVDRSASVLEREYIGDDIQKGIIFEENGTSFYVKGAQILHTNAKGAVVPVCMVGVIYNVDPIVRGRVRFILYSVLISLVLIAIVIAASTFFLRHSVIFPLRKLAEGALSFGKGDGKLSKDDVISLNITSDDEIGDLYKEIRSMQERIVDYTENLARITAEKERVGTELKMAAGIQAAVLPQDHAAFSRQPEFDLAASMDPAKEVGGDFYDYFMIDEKHLALMIADVSEKGVPASLFMMGCKTLIDYRTRLGGSPREILEAVNEEIAANNPSKMFITVWLGILDISTGRMICSNAGHEYPEVRGKDGQFRMLKDEHGLVMGIRPGTTYTDYELILNPGDAVFVYTDGLTDAKNPEGAFYGDERFRTVLNEKPLERAEDMLNAIREDVDRFTSGAEQFDDLTMLCLVYKGESGEQAPGKENADE